MVATELLPLQQEQLPQQQPASCEPNDLQVDFKQCKREVDVTTNWTSDKFGERRIGVALVGLGRMGLIHFRNLLREPRARILYCIDSDHSQLSACSKSMHFREFGIQALHSDQYEEVALRDPQVSVVIIATPTSQHEHQTRLALQAGKSVMCEKPLTPNTNNIIQLHELARANRVYLLTAFNRRYDPDFRQMRQQLLANRIGCLQMVRVTARDCRPPPLSYVRASSGLFHDACIHDIDLCLWMARQLPVSIQVLGKTWKEFYLNDREQLAKLSADDRELLGKIDDYFMAIITMKFTDGSLALIDNSRQASYGYDQRCELYGSSGMLKCDGKSPTSVIECTAAAIKHPTLADGFATRFNDAYENELQDILSMAELAQRASEEETKTQANGRRDDELTTAVIDGTEMVNKMLDKLEREHLLEPVRASLVLATHTIADACLEAAKSGQTIQMNWPDWLRRQFELEMQR
uniref:Putative oxidoreductase yrbE n=1 Tax=Aceria tosichella TaxID=561515 RepID=A0A6G1SAA2_9ACAR